jgi:hypothetical protein
LGPLDVFDAVLGDAHDPFALDPLLMQDAPPFHAGYDEYAGHLAGSMGAVDMQYLVAGSGMCNGLQETFMPLGYAPCGQRWLPNGLS